MFSDKEEKVPSLEQGNCHRILSCSLERMKEKINKKALLSLRSVQTGEDQKQGGG